MKYRVDRRLMRRLGVLVVVVMMVSVLPVATSTAGAAAPLRWSGTVIKVTDGDTFDVRLDNGQIQTIRVAGINTNEIHRDPKCWADEATTRLEKLVGGKRVVLRARHASSKAQGRQFRHVFRNGTNIAEKMLREGYGVPFVLTQEVDYIDDYVAAFYEANDAGRRIHDDDACGVGPAANLDMLVAGNADGPDAENPNGEFVQLRNNATSTLSLAGWLMHDSATDYYVFPNSASIAPGGVLQIHAGHGRDTSTHLYMGFDKQIYSNIDGAFLMDPDGDIRAFQSWPCDGLCGTSAVPRVVIDDLQYDGPGNDNDDPNVEWVRIKNVGRQPVDLLDWSFVSKPYVLYSTVSRVLHHNDTVTLSIGHGSDSQSAMYWSKDKSILNNEGDSIALVSRDGDVVACRAWGDDTCVETRSKGHDGTQSDFDGDGFDDLAVGVPGEDFGAKKNAGSVVVIPGKPNGVARGQGRVWSQKGTVAGRAQGGDRFGSSVDAGDFNGDGYDDLVAGSPGEDVSGIQNAGAVNVIYGSRTGLRKANNRSFVQGAVAGAPTNGDLFGSALDTGDFNGDGYDDLAVGSPGDTINSADNAGSVTIIYGSGAGLVTTGSTTVVQGADSSGGPQAGDQFATALSSGDFDGDGYYDLAVGTPNEAVNGQAGAGQVDILFGSASGVTQSSRQFFVQTNGGNGGVESGDGFGTALAAGDSDGDGYDDLGVGVPGERVNGHGGAGEVDVLRGTSSGLSTTGRRDFTQGGAIGESPAGGDHLGAALAAGDFDGDGFDDLMAGAPDENHGGATDAGVFHVFFGTADGVAVARDRLQAQRTSEAGNHYAASLTVLDIDGDGRDDIVAGSARDNLSGGADAGSVEAVFGRSQGHSTRSAITLSQNGSVPGRSERDDRFGQGL